MLRCARCKKQINGSYVNALKKAWHRECFRCEGCGRSIQESSFSQKEGKVYHRECYQKLFHPRCAKCDQVIIGAYTTALGKNWHPEHFTCTVCQKPLGKKFCERDGKPYCEEDYKKLFSPRCAICKKPLVDKFIVNAWGERFCPQHKKDYKECFSCGRLICMALTKGGVRYPDGYSICQICNSKAIVDPKRGQQILRQVQSTLISTGLPLKRQDIPVHLTSLKELKKISKSYNDQPAGMIRTQTKEVGGKIIQRDILEILVLRGLPLTHFSAVLAHEMGHAYLFTHGFPPLSPKIEEGFAEFCAYLWLQKTNTRVARYHIDCMKKNSHDIYGKGFQLALSSYRKNSPREILSHLRRKQQFP